MKQIFQVNKKLEGLLNSHWKNLAISPHVPTEATISCVTAKGDTKGKADLHYQSKERNKPLKNRARLPAPQVICEKKNIWKHTD